jgi:hypothetical protein
MNYGLTWTLYQEGTGMIIHKGVASDQKGFAEQIKTALEVTPLDLLLAGTRGRGTVLEVMRFQ